MKQEKGRKKGKRGTKSRKGRNKPNTPRRKSKLAVKRTPVKHGKKTSQGRAER